MEMMSALLAQILLRGAASKNLRETAFSVCNIFIINCLNMTRGLKMKEQCEEVVSHVSGRSFLYTEGRGFK